jgi:hypothetical protein
LTIAKYSLLNSGAVVWWQPEAASFESIQAEIDDLMTRAANITALKLGDELFNSEMYAIRAEIEAIQESLVAF